MISPRFCNQGLAAQSPPSLGNAVFNVNTFEDVRCCRCATSYPGGGVLEDDDRLAWFRSASIAPTNPATVMLRSPAISFTQPFDFLCLVSIAIKLTSPKTEHERL